MNDRAAAKEKGKQAAQGNYEMGVNKEKLSKYQNGCCPFPGGFRLKRRVKSDSPEECQLLTWQGPQALHSWVPRLVHVAMVHSHDSEFSVTSQ